MNSLHFWGNMCEYVCVYVRFVSLNLQDLQQFTHQTLPFLLSSQNSCLVDLQSVSGCPELPQNDGPSLKYLRFPVARSMELTVLPPSALIFDDKSPGLDHLFGSIRSWRMILEGWFWSFVDLLQLFKDSNPRVLNPLESFLKSIGFIRSSAWFRDNVWQSKACHLKKNNFFRPGTSTEMFTSETASTRQSTSKKQKLHVIISHSHRHHSTAGMFWYFWSYELFGLGSVAVWRQQVRCHPLSLLIFIDGFLWT